MRLAKASMAGRGGLIASKAAYVLAGAGALSSGAAIATRTPQVPLLAFGSGLICLTLGLWLQRDVLKLVAQPIDSTKRLDLLLPPSIVSAYKEDSGIAGLWQQLKSAWQVRFITSRFGLHPDIIDAVLADTTIDMDTVWAEAASLTVANGETRLTEAAIAVAILTMAPGVREILTAVKIDPADLAEGVSWITRLEVFQNSKRPIYGGLARDWASGYTPLLSQYGQNLSRQVELAGNRFGVQERTSQLDTLISSLANGTGSVVVVGEPGIGKTALLYGLADRLLQGNSGGMLAHHQVIALNASVILANQHGTGDLERIVLQLLSEAAHAGNIILALDEAQLFFGQGTGAANLSQVMLPVIQGRRLRLVFAITAADWQRMRSNNTALSGLLTPLVLSEPPQAEVLRLLADRALLLEQGTLTTTWRALIEAYRLSGRYFPDEAYPGKALKLLEASYTHAEGPFITEVSVQRAIESQLGVKVERAGTDETDVLLHLEDHIHQRMINQTHAVNVVAAALRRARAGVANPKRPVGSFLFLGPTGVGKTELARSLAALYFGAETNMVRLDMSEYQQSSDVARILAGAGESPQGLLAKVRQQPFSVVLFDEIEKADPAVLNLMLQLLDEGNLTDASGKKTSFKDAIIIATSNAGAEEIRHRIEAGGELSAFEQQFTDQLISSGQFKPELLNRFDEIVLFRPLGEPELAQVVALLIAEVNRTLEPQKISVTLTDAAITHLVKKGYDPRLGARPMRRMVTRTVEDAIAGRILRGETAAGDVITLTRGDVGGEAETPPSGPSIPAPKSVDSKVLFDRSKQ
jgi:ATP-dependent Clp protease ATP-binding subunit ClpC